MCVLGSTFLPSFLSPEQPPPGHPLLATIIEEVSRPVFVQSFLSFLSPEQPPQLPAYVSEAARERMEISSSFFILLLDVDLSVRATLEIVKECEKFRFSNNNVRFYFGEVGVTVLEILK